MLDEVVKKMISADVKQKEIQELVAVSFIFYSIEVPSKLKIQCNQACIFHLILLRIPYPAWSCPLRARGETGKGGGGCALLYNRQNPLSIITKVTCQQSLMIPM